MRNKLLKFALIMILLMSGCSGQNGGNGETPGSENTTEVVSEETEAVTEVVTEDISTQEETEEETEASIEKREEKLVEPSTEILTEAATEDVEDAFEEYFLSDIENLDEQLLLIAEENEIWKIEEDSDKDVAVGPTWFYTVTDLDMNGRLELITSSVEGTGMYSTSGFFEVSEDFNSLEKLEWEFPQGDSEPDITVEIADAYMDKEKGEYYYIFDDIVKASAADVYETLYSIMIKDGKIELEALGSSHMYSLNDGESVETETKDKNGKVITVDEYEELCQKEYPDAVKGSLSIGWNRVDGFDDSFPQDVEDIRLMLEYSSTGFAISFE